MVRLPQTPLACSFVISALMALAASPAIAQSNTTLRIMPLGDSITAGLHSTTGNGYRGPLVSDLAGQVLYVDMVGWRVAGSMSDPDHAGTSGDRIDQIASKTTSGLNLYKPNVVTLLAGINDIGQNYNVSTAPDRLASLIDQIFTNEPDATVLVADLIVNANANTESQVKTFNAALPNIVNTRASAGKHVYLVDTSALTTSDLADGLHPNDGGYVKLATAWYNAIQTVIGKGWIKDPVAGSITRPTGSLYLATGGVCLDGGSLASGNKAAISSCNGSAAQQWNLNNGNTGTGNGNVTANGMCLDIVNSGTANKSLVQLEPCNKGVNQIFNINSNNTLVNPASGRCLDDPGSSTTNGTQLQIFDCNGGPNQTWLMPQQGPLTSGISGKCLDAKGGSPNTGTHVDSFACNGNFSQQWSIYNNLIKFDGRCVGVVGGGTGNGSLVELESCSGASSQKWTPTNGALVNGSGRCLAVPGSSTTDGIQLDIEDCSSGTNQKWALPNL